MILPWIAATTSLAFAGEMSSLRREWGLVPADPARPGLWKARAQRDEAFDLMVRIDSTPSGDLLREEWSAERGPRAIDIPDERFWQILDRRSRDAEWIETDPDALPSGVLGHPVAELAQGFRCPTCHPALVAATWNAHGATRLLIARTGPAPLSASRTIVVDPSVSEGGIESLARQRGLEIASRNPCRVGQGSCTIELAGSRGERWVLTRSSAGAPWGLEKASFGGSAWWNPEWSWDSLRTESPREFALVLRNWLDAELDVIGERLVRPLEPILNVGTSQWNRREIDGLGVGPVVDRLVTSPHPPSTLELSSGPRLRVTIDAFGRRTLEFPKAAR